MTLRNQFGEVSTEETLAEVRDRIPVPTPGGRLPVDVEGANITGTFTVQPSVASTLNVPDGPLGPSEVFTGQWEDVLAYSGVQVAIFTDKPSVPNGAQIQFSADGVNVLRSVPTTIPADFAAYFHLAPQARYVRFVYINGPSAQTVLRLSILYSYNPPAEVVQPIGSTVTDANIATVTRSALAGRIMSGPSAGAYAPLGTDGTGKLLVDTELSAAGPLATEATASLTLAAVQAQTPPQTDALTETQLRSAPVVVDTELAAAGPLATEATLVEVRDAVAAQPATDVSALATEATLVTLGFTSQDIHARLSDGTQKAVVSTEAGLTTPTLPSTGRGSILETPALLAGTYTFTVTARLNDGETLPSPVATRVIPSGSTDDLITVFGWQPVEGSTGYNLYASTPADPVRRLVFSNNFGGADGPSTGFSFQGPSGPPRTGRVEPTVNSTIPGSSVATEVTLLSRATEATAAGIRTDLGTDGTGMAALPTGATGVRGLLRAIRELLTGTLTVQQVRTTTPVRSTVNVGTTATTVKLANPNRKKIYIYNAGNTAVLFSYGGAASAGDYTFQLGSGAFYEDADYTGVITGITTLGTSALRVTELT